MYQEYGNGLRETRSKLYLLSEVGVNGGQALLSLQNYPTSSHLSINMNLANFGS
jgi:hypothetical protein